MASSSSPVTVATRFSAWEPMSPMAPAMPLRAGSVRQAACGLAPFASTWVASQPWWYSTTTLRSSPRMPARTIALAWRTMG